MRERQATAAFLFSAVPSCRLSPLECTVTRPSKCCTILVQITPLDSALTDTPTITPLECAVTKQGGGGTHQAPWCAFAPCSGHPFDPAPPVARASACAPTSQDTRNRPRFGARQQPRFALAFSTI